MAGLFGQLLDSLDTLTNFLLIQVSAALNLYLALNGIAAWDEKFQNFSGAGVSISPRFVFSPDDWWAGAQIQVVPDYKYFLTGALDGEGDATLEINVGGQFTPTIMWDVIGQKNYDLDLRSLNRGADTGLKNDWNIFINVTTYF